MPCRYLVFELMDYEKIIKLLYSTIKEVYRKVYDLLFDNTFLLIHVFLWFKTQKAIKGIPIDSLQFVFLPPLLGGSSVSSFLGILSEECT